MTYRVIKIKNGLIFSDLPPDAPEAKALADQEGMLVGFSVMVNDEWRLGMCRTLLDLPPKGAKDEFVFLDLQPAS